MSKENEEEKTSILGLQFSFIKMELSVLATSISANGYLSHQS